MEVSMAHTMFLSQFGSQILKVNFKVKIVPQKDKWLTDTYNALFLNIPRDEVNSILSTRVVYSDK